LALDDERPVGLMTGYQGSTGPDDERNEAAFAGGRYHTGDIAHRDEEGYITYVGRADDVFKASDYRISPFELESVLIEHPAVAEAAVVPAPDELRLAVPKAYVSLVAGYEPSRALAGEILAYAKEHLAPYKRVRRLEFAELPKTISGKIRRVDLRCGSFLIVRHPRLFVGIMDHGHHQHNKKRLSVHRSIITFKNSVDTHEQSSHRQKALNHCLLRKQRHSSSCQRSENSSQQFNSSTVQQFSSPPAWHPRRKIR
jgi:hypothetical protein